MCFVFYVSWFRAFCGKAFFNHRTRPEHRNQDTEKMIFQMPPFSDRQFDRQADSMSYEGGANEKLVESDVDGFVSGSFGMFVSEAERSGKKERECAAADSG